MPLISVIVPVYNVEKYLDRCLQSIADQTLGDFEALLVDDGSSDSSGAICDRWAQRDPRFRVIHRENGGMSEARNTGLDQRTGEFVSFVDSDDYLEPGCLEYLYQMIRDLPDCRICQANHYLTWENKRKPNDPGQEDAVLSVREAAEAVLFHDRVDVSPWGKLYRSSLFDHLRFPPGRRYEDTWLFADLLLSTVVYAYGHVPQYNYVKNPASIVHQSFSEKNLEYLEAADRLTELIGSRFPELQAGCVRRRNHARLSVLRYMEHCGEEYLPLREKLRQQVLAEAPEYISLPRTPKRDRIAVRLLRLGWTAFYQGWKAYLYVRKM